MRDENLPSGKGQLSGRKRGGSDWRGPRVTRLSTGTWTAEKGKPSAMSEGSKG